MGIVGDRIPARMTRDLDGAPEKQISGETERERDD
jgi:hypothetical protein